MKVMNLLYMALCAMMLASCQGGGDGRYVVDYIPYVDNEDDSYGLWGSDGSILKTTIQFNEAPSPVVNGYFHYEDEDRFMQICKVEDGRCVEKHWLDSLQFVGIMNDGRIPVCEYRKPIKVLDENGKEVFMLDKINGVEVVGCLSYSCGRMRVLLNDGKYLYVDRQGAPLFGATYDLANDFSHGYAMVCVDEDKGAFAVIDVDGNTVFTFNCSNKDYLEFAPQYDRLATINDDDRIVIYNFKGEIVNTYPTKVESVYALCEDCFIFKNGYEYGLMAYTGEELIRAKYDQLVPNGKYFLATRHDNDEEVRVINQQDEVLAMLDGEEICSLTINGYEFPNIIGRSDEELYLVDDYAEIIGNGAHDFDFNKDGVTYDRGVGSDYFPEAEVLARVMELCGNGSGVPESQGVFFVKNGNHCLPKDIAFIANSSNIESYRGESYAIQSLENSVNYAIEFYVLFDEPIVKEGADKLNTTAWLEMAVVKVLIWDQYKRSDFHSLCKEELRKLGCEMVGPVVNGRLIYISNDAKNSIETYEDSEACYFILQPRQK